MISQFQGPHPLKNFSYLIVCNETKRCAVVDPSFCGKQLLQAIQRQDLFLDYILNTHAHHDHIHDNSVLIESFPNAKIAGGYTATQENYLPLKDEQIINLGTLKIKALHTPGHTREDTCFYVENNLLTGDFLFVRKVGGTRDRESAHRQFQSLKKITALPDQTKIYPGHNNGPKSTSTLAEEKKENPFILRLSNFDDFWWLKENWRAFKQQHGL